MSRTLYADIIIEISTEKLDRTFQYRIPEALKDKAVPGSLVAVPFGRGNRSITGYIVNITSEPEFDPEKTKDITEVRNDNRSQSVGKLLILAAWMKHHYGGTLIQSLKVVLPKKTPVKPVEKQTVRLAVSESSAQVYAEEFQKKHQVARLRLLLALMEADSMDKRLITQKLGVGSNVIKALCDRGLARIDSETSYRKPLASGMRENAGGLHGRKITALTNDQKNVIASVLSCFDMKDLRPSLIHGVTGSGKTEVYIDIIDGIVKRGYQAIMLIPEISLTYQTVVRFTARFGDRVSFIHSKLSTGERYDQFLRAEKGEIDVMIGPRSALFTPFPRLGIIVMDEEHETSYKSEKMPKYHTRETAEKLAGISGAAFVMGSATPSVEAYERALSGKYRLYGMPERIAGGALPVVYTVDLRQELANGNKSIFSGKLRELMEDRLDHDEQIMLFLNRRGYSSFVTCRKCGFVYKCPHCDVSLSLHSDRRLYCHYCGYTTPMKETCPECGSGYIGGMRAGTEQVENMVHRVFPGARTIRMDTDTTRRKGDYEKILSAFANEEADILIGTQMIVKGHDFPRVTLMGILAADMSLFSGDYRSAERTFELLTQAAGRAGRASQAGEGGRRLMGEVVIQTYSPDNYAVVAAAHQDYRSFFNEEISYRRIGGYPPSGHLLQITIEDKEEERARATAEGIAGLGRSFLKEDGAGRIRPEKSGEVGAGKYLRTEEEGRHDVQVIGPADASISKINDVYRKVVYVKSGDYELLAMLKDVIENDRSKRQDFSSRVEFDFNP
ncbi:MAG: primosomal protein N' [Lachnospiraceae bacterium]|nr:primosomal protein N' [Lachnospiraceae bacterium]